MHAHDTHQYTAHRSTTQKLTCKTRASSGKPVRHYVHYCTFGSCTLPPKCIDSGHDPYPLLRAWTTNACGQYRPVLPTFSGCGTSGERLDAVIHKVVDLKKLEYQSASLVPIGANLSDFLFVHRPRAKPWRSAEMDR